MQVTPSSLTLEYYNGTISLFSREFDILESAIEQDSSSSSSNRRRHVTFLTPSEYKSLNRPSLESIQVELGNIYILGPASKGLVKWEVVIWNHGNQWRHQRGLGRKDFHITLSETDDWEVRKGIGSVLGRVGEEELVKRVEELGELGMNHVVVACKDDHLSFVSPDSDPPSGALCHNAMRWYADGQRRELSERMIAQCPNSFRGYLRYAESCLSSQEPKLACLAYGQALTLHPEYKPQIINKLRSLRDQVTFGPTLTAEEYGSIPDQIRPMLLRHCPNSQLSQSNLRYTLWDWPTESRDRQIYVTYSSSTSGPIAETKRELPRRFSWVYPYRIAGISTPRHEEDITTLIDMGITHILTLTEESPLDPRWFINKKVKHHFMPVPNYSAPTTAEMDHIYGWVKQGGLWLVHCGGGVGRAGTVLACLIAMFGNPATTEEIETVEAEDTQAREACRSLAPRLNAGTAIALLRQTRPGSLETEVQERFVSKWIKHRWTSLNRAEMDEPYTVLRDTDLQGLKIDPSNMDNVVLFLIGKPGSGKSWFSSSILKRRDRDKTLVVSQDESGSRVLCETDLSRRRSPDTLIILDRCNPTKKDRKEWLKLTDRHVIAVYFEYDKELCRQRIDKRVGHPTIRAGRGQNALDQMSREMEPPTLDEGFRSIITITSFSASRQVIRRLTPPITLLKFPRTPHLLNLGAVTPDDIVQESFETITGHLTIEEKIDGANMGLSLDYDGVVRVQNRSHWVSSADHAQFKPLDNWVECHREALAGLLGRDEQYPERYILYGEWCVAKHSIHYTSLPDRFIAFDLYDRYANTFLSRTALSARLDGTGISQVPLLAQMEQVTREEVMRMLAGKSKYGEGKVEGVYVRWEDADRRWTERRGKVVRGDFIAGNDHWTKGNLVLNGIAWDHAPGQGEENE